MEQPWSNSFELEYVLQNLEEIQFLFLFPEQNYDTMASTCLNVCLYTSKIV